MPRLVLHNLNDALIALDRLEHLRVTSASPWSLYRLLHHCAQTIDYAMTGYPASKPVWFQRIIGKLVLHRFMRQGYMRHNLQAPVPGSPALLHEGTAQEGIALLRQTIHRFQQYRGTLHPHAFFGQLTHEEYDRYFAMHIADHLSATGIK